MTRPRKHRHRKQPRLTARIAFLSRLTRTAGTEDGRLIVARLTKNVNALPVVVAYALEKNPRRWCDVEALAREIENDARMLRCRVDLYTLVDEDNITS